MHHLLVFSSILLILPFGNCGNENCYKLADIVCPDGYHACNGGLFSGHYGLCIKCQYRYVDCAKCECTWELDRDGLWIVIGLVSVAILLITVISSDCCGWCRQTRDRVPRQQAQIGMFFAYSLSHSHKL